jgi:hypothetical protein
MPHAWPGGTTDPKYKGYGDPTAPDGAEATWAFLKRYRKSDTAMPCAEAPVAAVQIADDTGAPTTTRPKRCPARWLTLRVPRGAKRVRATVGGKRVKARLARGRVRVRVPAGYGARRVVVRGRTAKGRPFVRRRVACGRLSPPR